MTLPTRNCKSHYVHSSADIALSECECMQQPARGRRQTDGRKGEGRPGRARENSDGAVSNANGTPGQNSNLYKEGGASASAPLGMLLDVVRWGWTPSTALRHQHGGRAGGGCGPITVFMLVFLDVDTCAHRDLCT